MDLSLLEKVDSIKLRHGQDRAFLSSLLAMNLTLAVQVEYSGSLYLKRAAKVSKDAWSGVGSKDAYPCAAEKNCMTQGRT